MDFRDESPPIGFGVSFSRTSSPSTCGFPFNDPALGVDGGHNNCSDGQELAQYIAERPEQQDKRKWFADQGYPVRGYFLRSGISGPEGLPAYLGGP